MGNEKQWEARWADGGVGTIRLRDSSLDIDPSGASRPVHMSQAEITVARARVTPETHYGSLCTISEHGMEKTWRILSDVELGVGSYDAPDTTDMEYDVYMAPDQFEGLIRALIPPDATAMDAGFGHASAATEFQAARLAGTQFVILLLVRIFGSILLVGAAVFLFADAFPELEEHATMILVALLPVVSLGIVWRTRARPGHRIRISQREVVISRVGKPRRVVIRLEDAVIFRVNWVGSGRYGRVRMGPALEFCHGDRKKTRIALSDTADLWPDKVDEIPEPHFVISRQAWDVLRTTVLS